MIDLVRLREHWNAAQRPHAAQNEARNAAFLALPDLLAIAEAAVEWRAQYRKSPPRSWVAFDDAEAALIAAVDARLR